MIGDYSFDNLFSLDSNMDSMEVNGAGNGAGFVLLEGRMIDWSAGQVHSSY